VVKVMKNGKWDRYEYVISLRQLSGRRRVFVRYRDLHRWNAKLFPQGNFWQTDGSAVKRAGWLQTQIVAIATRSADGKKFRRHLQDKVWLEPPRDKHGFLRDAFLIESFEHFLLTKSKKVRVLMDPKTAEPYVPTGDTAGQPYPALVVYERDANAYHIVFQKPYPLDRVNPEGLDHCAYRVDLPQATDDAAAMSVAVISKAWSGTAGHGIRNNPLRDGRATEVDADIYKFLEPYFNKSVPGSAVKPSGSADVRKREY